MTFVRLRTSFRLSVYIPCIVVPRGQLPFPNRTYCARKLTTRLFFQSNGLRIVKFDIVISGLFSRPTRQQYITIYVQTCRQKPTEVKICSIYTYIYRFKRLFEKSMTIHRIFSFFFFFLF